jgi:hypothetical protein
MNTHGSGLPGTRGSVVGWGIMLAGSVPDEVNGFSSDLLLPASLWP